MKNLAIFAFLLFSLLSTRITAQQNSFQTRVYFETNSSELDRPAKKNLDSIVQVLNSYPAYELELSAHTDQSGGEEYNETLSEKREDVVFDYLVKHGLMREHISSMHHGEEQPVVESSQTETIAENRRVEIIVSYTAFSNPGEVLAFAGIQSEQRFVFRDDGIQEVQGTKGTQLIIPTDAFQTKDGVPVPNSEVTFVLEEFPGIGEAVTHQLSTLSDGRILESGGMFRMEAYFEGQELELRKGKQVDVQLPSDNIQPGMSVFVGTRNEQGVVEWEDTKAPFKTADTTEKPKLPLPGYAKLLQDLRVPYPEKPTYKAMAFGTTVPKIPVRPNEPVKPTPPASPIMEQDGEGRKGIFSQERKEQKRVKKKYEQDMAFYQRRLDSYNRRMENYRKKYALYQADSASYKETKEAWENLLDSMYQERMILLSRYQDYYDAQRYNGGLTSISRRMNDSSYYNSYLVADLRRASEHRVENDMTAAFDRLFQDMQLLVVLRSDQFGKVQRYLCTKNKVDYLRYTSNLRNRKLQKVLSSSTLGLQQTFYRKNRYYSELWTDSLKRMALQELELTIIEKKEDLGILEKNDVGNVYSASLSGMGFINCDRFSNFPPQQMAGLDVNVPLGSRVFVVIPRINAVLPLYSGHDSTSSVQLPIGEEIKIVTIGTLNGQPTFDHRKHKVKADTNLVRLEPKQVSIRTLRERLSGL